MLYAHSSLGNAIQYIHRNLSPEDRMFLSGDPIYHDNGTLRYARVLKMAYLVLHDYSDGRYEREHPVRGLSVTVASFGSSRGMGHTDQLIQNAIEDVGLMEEVMPVLVAEIDPRNVRAIDLFQRNGFTHALDANDLSYYVNRVG